MSHFAVLVIGPNPESQLAPYHEFECTGVNDQYVQDVDVTDKCREEGISYYGLEDRTVTDESQVDRNGKHKWGYAIVDAEGNLVKAVDRTNPNKKWDWYQVGGRWFGFLKLKPGHSGINGERSLLSDLAGAKQGYCDQTTKGSVDFEAMRNEAADGAAEAWDKAYAIHQGQSWEPWKVVGPRTNYDNASRDFYNGQPVVQALRKGLQDFDVDQYLTPREEFIQQRRDSGTVLFGYLKDGKWQDQGDMGWFGCVANEKDEGEWTREFNAMLESIPDDTLLTVVDCHI